MKKTITAIALIVLVNTGFAQDTLRNNEFDVIKDFKPTLTDIIKIPSNPNPEVPEVKAPKLDYTLPNVKLNADPTIYTIKPLAMGTALLPKLKNNYFRLGYGNYSSPIIEAYITTARNKTSQAGVYVKHFSANPEDKRAFSNNALKLWGKRFMGKGAVTTDVAFNRNVIHYYGYQPKNIDIKKSDLRRQYAALDVHAGYSNIIKDTAKLKFNLDANFYNFIDNNESIENDFKLNGNFSKRINGNPLDVGIGVNTNNTKTKLYEYNRVFVDINPEYTLTFPKAFIKIGFNSTFFNDSQGTNFFFFPKAEAAYQITPKTVTAYAGITGNLNRTTYRGLVNENPFISNFSLLNTENNFEIYGGFKGEISSQTSFMLQFSHAIVRNLMFYGFDNTSRGQTTIFDTTNAGLSNIKAEINHEFGEKFHLNFVMNYYAYSLQITQPFSRPTFTTRTSIMYNIGNKFIIRSDVYTMNKRKSIELSEKKEFNLNAITDLNLSIDYRYTKNVSLFLLMNNLTNNQYQRWFDHKVYGFNILGGLSVTF